MTQLLFLTRRRDVTPDEIRITDLVLKDGTGEAQPPTVLIRGKVASPTGNEPAVVIKFREQLMRNELVKSAEIDPSKTLLDKGEFRFEIAVGAGRIK